MTFGLGRLTYEFKNQNPVLDYIAEIEELPDRWIFNNHKI